MLHLSLLIHIACSSPAGVDSWSVGGETGDSGEAVDDTGDGRWTSTETLPLSEGLCEASGFCWALPTPMGLDLREVHASSGETAWMLAGRTSVLRWSEGQWLRAQLPSAVGGVAPVSDDEAWAVCEGALFRITAEGAERFEMPSGYGRSVATDGQGTLWVSGESGILEGDGEGNWEAISEFGVSLYWLEDALWAGDYGWILRWDGAEWTQHHGSDDTIDELLRGPDGVLYLASLTRGVVTVLDGETATRMEGTDGYGHDLAAVSGGVWAVDWGGPGVAFLGLEGEVQSLETPAQLESLGATGETVFGAGVAGRLVRVSEGSVEDLNPGLELGGVYAAAGTRDDLWVGTAVGLLHRDAEEWTLFETEDEVRALVLNAAGITAVIGQEVVFPDGESLPLPVSGYKVTGLAWDSQGTLQLATTEGLFALKDDAWESSLDGRFASTLLDTPEGLFAVVEGGLKQHSGDQWLTVSKPSGCRDLSDLGWHEELWMVCGDLGEQARLFHGSEGSWEELEVPEGQEPAALAVSAQGLWLADTNGYQLSHLEDGTWSVYHPESNIRPLLWAGEDVALMATVHGALAIR